jgi:uncharacterized protein (DUF1501 family)
MHSGNHCQNAEYPFAPRVCRVLLTHVAIQGGQTFGAFPTFELGGPDDAGFRGRWIPTTSIDQYGATLCSWFGIPDSALATVFPNFVNFGSKKLGFLG